VIGLPRSHFRVTDSTNDRARALAHARAPHGTLVTAGAQTAGRGRQGRRWEAPPDRTLLMSVLLRGVDPGATLLPLLAALAVCEGAEAAAGVACAVKWPNDVWVGERKAAGILVEARPADGWAIVGIGLNVAATAPELPEGATSLGLEAARPVGVEDALRAVLASLDRALGLPRAEVLARLRSRDALRGRRVAWASGEGTAAGIGDAGELLVDTAGGPVGLASGEVHLSLGRT
jgi:BirA family biotin operon repressor/biotin-[acetyl-CoA-carboxylase] ligase